MTTCLIRLMSLVSEGIMGAAGGCQRNWSTYDFITNRKRNNLAPQRAEDLVYVHFNRRCVLKSREPEQFASWLDDDVQLLPVEGE